MAHDQQYLKVPEKNQKPPSIHFQVFFGSGTKTRAKSKSFFSRAVFFVPAGRNVIKRNMVSPNLHLGLRTKGHLKFLFRSGGWSCGSAF